MWYEVADLDILVVMLHDYQLLKVYHILTSSIHRIDRL